MSTNWHFQNYCSRFRFFRNDSAELQIRHDYPLKGNWKCFWKFSIVLCYKWRESLRNKIFAMILFLNFKNCGNSIALQNDVIIWKSFSCRWIKIKNREIARKTYGMFFGDIGIFGIIGPVISPISYIGPPSFPISCVENIFFST